MEKYDLIVIGSGAGLNVAAGAAQKGWNVAIIEKESLGGTCLNRGCIPSKIVIHSAEVADCVMDAKKFGIDAELKGVDFAFVTDRANKTVDGDSERIRKGLLESGNPKLYQGEAKFVSEKVIEINGEQIEGKQILIAAGARPSVVPIDGIDEVEYMTSTEALRRKKLPKSMIVIGGGYIACELGHFYAELGCKITVVQRADRLLRREDHEVSDLITKRWAEKYDVWLGSTIKNVSKKGDNIVLVADVKGKEKKVEAEALFVATGVKTYLDTLDISKAGVKTNDKGFIEVNDYMQTNVDGIWALGDIAGKYMFRHSANLEAGYVLNNLFSEKKKVDYYPMPHAVFTHPQIAGVGLTEEECKGKDYVVGKAFYKNTGMGAALEEKDGFVKFIVDKKSHEILGCHIIGPEASILLHEVLVAMKADKKKALHLIRQTVHIHPAMSEVVQRAANAVDL